ncbi:hypothetical protein GCM10010218_45660 [Streptomyces mashuensis]|uniref:Integral membrane protein n=1 Tax=Streptomyces mashuensis TaxID=33904 RepID=A0A919EEN6_9ACTN|nr:hypothetical protein [Streptomyces mashuensis]GHF59110.1 hypothetical protein GCM10010218_45660 [Streptomyces mashuensis]
MSGLLRLVPDHPGPVHDLAAPARPRTGPRWAADPVDELAAELAGVCAAAVHPDEIAAVLEADGLTGEQITERYGRADAFALAAELFDRVPRAHPEPPPVPDPWQVRPGRFALRSLVFTLPGLGYALAAPLLAGPPGAHGLPVGTGALVASAVTAWTWNQALAHRAYVRLAAGGRRAAARCLAVGAPLGALVATGAALALPSVPPGVAAFAAGQALYLAAATALLVLGHERLLLLALVPTAAGGAAAHAVPLPAAAGPVLLLATEAGALFAAGYAVLRTRRETPPPSGPLPPLTASLPYGLFGLGCAGLTTVAALGDAVTGRGTGGCAASVLALTLSMGAAEWLLYRVRSRSLAALGASVTTGGLLLRAAGVLAAALTGYLVLLAALALAAGVLWPPGPGPLAPRLVALLALGAVLWAGLLLQAYGVAWLPALLCAAAAGTETTVLFLGAASPLTAQAMTCTGAAAALLAAATVLLGRLTTHR